MKLASPEVRGSIQIVGIGKERDIPHLYSHATMTVLPSEKEPFGMVLVESLAAKSALEDAAVEAFDALLARLNRNGILEREAMKEP